jgi:hypothetical protein
MFQDKIRLYLPKSFKIQSDQILKISIISLILKKDKISSAPATTRGSLPLQCYILH